jgi:hypothetical protein
MNIMSMPGFTAETTIGSRGFLRSVSGGRRGLGFSCDPLGCVCRGTDDCIDLWVNTDLCSGSIICYGDAAGGRGYCYCVRK